MSEIQLDIKTILARQLLDSMTFNGTTIKLDTQGEEGMSRRAVKPDISMYIK
jgi:hypothetical protein